MARTDDEGLSPTDASGTPLAIGARVIYATSRGGGLLQEGVITRVTPGICIKRPDGKVITIGTPRRVAVVPHLDDVKRDQTQKWIDFCRRNREHAIGRWADEELRLAQERLKKRDKDELDNWWRDYKEGL